MSAHRPIRTVLLGALLALAAAVGPASAFAQTPTPSPATPGPTRAQLEAATYPVPAIPGGTATRVCGKFEVAAAPDSANKATATLVSSANGVIGGQPGAAVVLATSVGGSGTFFELYAVDVTAKTIAQVALGDRIRLDGLSISTAGQVAVAMTAQAPGDPLCCPTAQQTSFYELQKTPAGTFDLVLVRTATAQIQPPRPATTGTGGVADAWQVEASFAAVVLGAVLAACVAVRGISRRAS